MEDSYNYTHITGAVTNQVICPLAAKLVRVINNKPVASQTMTLLDGSNTVAVITLPATLLQEGGISTDYYVNCGSGIKVTTTGSSVDWTIVWK